MNCIIVDDEPIARQGILNLTAKVPDLIVKGLFKNSNEARLYLEKNVVDLIFLDIEMPGINGIEFAKSISKKTLVIFTTAHAQYALESYEIDAIDYLLKPISEDRFLKAATKAIEFNYFLSDDFEKSSFESIGENSIIVRADRRIYKILHKDIFFIEGMKDYSIINSKDNKIITAMNLKTILSQLPPQFFKRISKSYIVNYHHVLSVSPHAVHLQGIELPLGNTYRNEFINEFIKKKD
ncbi:DNA-binding response regulator [Chryseobacterium sp. T16E-39]|uniref:LytR/AlgR family response regulator transcription factor n=1 Tax=Chryseobacterium sp. T16E-39 TaxID=2015076 RepID=UPI000B5B37EE|nr:LytTR family DNA-binding domain-containing protein [Chryseobacterium sp. T16E-39]ASK28929.1 DNA-binding response regulator [Chryseobacterium sp. T16E-39]